MRMKVLDVFKNYDLKVILSHINVIFKETKNGHDAILYTLGIKKQTQLKFKKFGNVTFYEKDRHNGFFTNLISSFLKPLTAKQIKIIQSLIDQKDNEILNIDDIKFKNIVWVHLFEHFVYDVFGLHHIDNANGNESVIDIGANTGDTALNFANKGYDVYAFEPVTETYNLAIENIKFNPHLMKKIKMIKKGVCSKNGKAKIYFDDLGTYNGDSNMYQVMDNFETIETMTIEKILEEYNIKPGILKIDCEGCEVEIILNSDLSMFELIFFEHHKFITNVSHEKLIEKLESQGFELVGKTEFQVHADNIAMRKMK
jgi:FkbM family methyltransferase